MHEIKNLQAFCNCFGSMKLNQLPNGELNPTDSFARKMHLKEENQDIYYEVMGGFENLVNWCLPKKIINQKENIYYVLSYTTEHNNFFQLYFGDFDEALRKYDIIIKQFDKANVKIFNISITKELYHTETSLVWGYKSD